MGGQTGSQQQQTQSTTQLPPWINDAAQQNYAFAQNVANRPLQQYQGQMVPDTSDQMQQAWNTAATAGNAGVPQLNAATAGFAGALGQTPMSVTNPGNANAVTAGNVGDTDLQKYMNPYTQSVINSSLADHATAIGAVARRQRRQRGANRRVRRLKIRRPTRHGPGARSAWHGEHGRGPEQPELHSGAGGSDRRYQPPAFGGDDEPGFAANGSRAQSHRAGITRPRNRTRSTPTSMRRAA